MNQTEKPMPDPSKKKEVFFLVTGEIWYVPDPEKNELVARNINTLFSAEDPQLRQSDINRAMEALQMSFHKKIENDGSIVIRDVVITMFTPLGMMTRNEFFNTKKAGE